MFYKTRAGYSYRPQLYREINRPHFERDLVSQNTLRYQLF